LAKSLQKSGNFAGKFLPEGDLMVASDKRSYEFGSFRLDAAEYILLRDGQIVPLTPKVFETLLVLVENSGHVVDKNELYKQVWQDAFVEETNLTKNISILRKILSEGDAERSFIETVPKRGYRFVVPVRKSGSEDSENGSKSVASLDKKIAVLPFANFSGDPQNDYFCDGLAEELLNALAIIKGLKVAARTSSFSFRGKNLDVSEIGAALGVNTVLEGSVRKSGNRLRITAQLVSASDGFHIWSGQYDRELSDIFAVQEEITLAIVDSLKLKLLEDQRTNVLRRYTENTQAYSLYLRGRFSWNKRTTEDVIRAIRYFEEAIDLDPNYALAYTGIADCYSASGFSYDLGLPAGEVISRAKSAAAKAFEIDETLAEAQTSLAYAELLFDWDFEQAEALFRRALELNPNYANARHWYTHLLMALSRFDEALVEGEAALELDPLSAVMNTHLGWHFLCTRENDLAIAQFHRTFTLDSKFVVAQWYLALAFEQAGRYSEAEAAFREALLSTNQDLMIRADAAHLYAVSGQHERALSELSELEKLSETKFVSSFGLALICVGLGDDDRAFGYFEKAVQEHSEMLIYLNVDSRFDRIRPDSRFETLIKRVGLLERPGLPTPDRETVAQRPAFQGVVETDEPAGIDIDRTLAAPLSSNGVDKSTDSALESASKPTQTDRARPTSSAEYILSQIKTHKYGFAGLLGIAALLIAGVGFGLYKLAFQKKTGTSLASTQITRLTSSGNVIKAAISADGKWLVYVESEGDRQSLWLKQIAVPGSNTQIMAPANVGYPGVAISPDGNYVYYTLAEPGSETGTLYQVPLLGGTPRKLFTGVYGSVALSPDGKQIAYFYWIDDEDRLMVANKDGTGQRQLVSRRGNEFLVFIDGLSWSPDSKNILTTIGTFTPEQSMTVAVVSPENGAITLFSQQKFKRIDAIAWLANGQGVLVSATDEFASNGPGGSNKIWQISYPSGNGQRITNDLNSYQTISLTADSNSLATVQTETVGNLWIASMNELANSSQITSGRHLAQFPSWAHDGKVVYVLNSGGNFDLYLLDPREGATKQLTANSGNNHYPVVSPDGRYVVFCSDRSGVLCLWRIDIDGSNPKQLTNENSLLPSFAPDSRTIVYVAATNKTTLSTVSIDGGEPRQLTRNSTLWPVLSPDGTRIACLYSEEPNSPSRISIIPANGGPSIKAFPPPSGLTLPLRWTADGKAILYGITRGGVTNLWMQPVESGEAKQLTNFTSDRIYSFEVSRDGKQLVLSRGPRSSDVVLFSGIRQ
jgi:TolB-like protein/Tol biopolymer transport system component/Tfp pilus assembly protein PilF